MKAPGRSDSCVRTARTDREANHHVAHDLAHAIRIHGVAYECKREGPDTDRISTLDAVPHARSAAEALQNPRNHERSVTRTEHEEDNRAEHQADRPDERPLPILYDLAEDANGRRRHDQSARICCNEPAVTISRRAAASERTSSTTRSGPPRSPVAANGTARPEQRSRRPPDPPASPTRP